MDLDSPSIRKINKRIKIAYIITLMFDIFTLVAYAIAPYVYDVPGGTKVKIVIAQLFAVSVVFVIKKIIQDYKNYKKFYNKPYI